MILGIDYGRKKIGLAIADMESKLSDPLVVLRVKDQEETIRKLKDVIQKENIDKVVLGVSEGDMAKETKKFGKKLEEVLELPIDHFDETLSSKSAQELSLRGGIKRKKRKKMEDAYAAAIMLQGYLDTLKLTY